MAGSVHQESSEHGELGMGEAGDLVQRLSGKVNSINNFTRNWILDSADLPFF